jgi:hypothetical protein
MIASEAGRNVAAFRIYSGDTATFNTPSVTALTLSGNVTINSVTFQPGTGLFTINTSGHWPTYSGSRPSVLAMVPACSGAENS